MHPVRAAPGARAAPLARPKLTLSSKNYSSWSLRGWLMARFAGLDFDEVKVSPDDADARKDGKPVHLHVDARSGAITPMTGEPEEEEEEHESNRQP